MGGSVGEGPLEPPALMPHGKMQPGSISAHFNPPATRFQLLQDSPLAAYRTAHPPQVCWSAGQRLTNPALERFFWGNAEREPETSPFHVLPF